MCLYKPYCRGLNVFRQQCPAFRRDRPKRQRPKPERRQRQFGGAGRKPSFQIFDGSNFVLDETLKMKCLDVKVDLVEGCCSSGTNKSDNFGIFKATFYKFENRHSWSIIESSSPSNYLIFKNNTKFWFCRNFFFFFQYRSNWFFKFCCDGKIMKMCCSKERRIITKLISGFIFFNRDWNFDFF